MTILKQHLKTGKTFGRTKCLPPSFNQEQLTALLHFPNKFKKLFRLVELWDMSDFEENALCGIVADAFAEKGIRGEGTVLMKPLLLLTSSV